MYSIGFFQLSKERNPPLCHNMYEHYATGNGIGGVRDAESQMLHDLTWN